MLSGTYFDVQFPYLEAFYKHCSCKSLAVKSSFLFITKLTFMNSCLLTLLSSSGFKLQAKVSIRLVPHLLPGEEMEYLPFKLQLLHFFPLSSYTPSTHISISIHNTRFFGNLDKQLQCHVNGGYLRRYTQSKHKWSGKAWDIIDMTAFVKNLRPYHWHT